MLGIKINGSPIAVNPSVFQPTILDLDDAESTTRTSDGVLNRDRVAVKRQIQVEFPPMPMPKMSALLKQMSGVFFEFYFPDPMAGGYVTKTMYVGDRPAPMVIVKNGVVWWDTLKVTLTEK
ncbi:DUF6711 family protein [Paenibacillus sp. S150]|uniref:DUF6711 family protein n=1 Tax=Paenibacillus sp. S150 TaxID=2749826 RepID=UPI001C59F4BA|nr:DUF6711 family protein [Paenibacillus sp. S150]MBW4083533.1 hypothetical protein [Paenibacillus sp. S150]